MAFAGSPTDSVQRAAQRSATKISAHDWGRLQYAFFDYTHSAGAGTGEINLLLIPAGRVRILTDLCRIITSDMEANAVMDVGYRAYNDPEAATPAVVEDDNYFQSASAVGAGARDEALLLPASGHPVFNTRFGLEIFASIDTGNIADGDTLSGFIAYVRGG